MREGHEGQGVGSGGARWRAEGQMLSTPSTLLSHQYDAGLHAVRECGLCGLVCAQPKGTQADACRRCCMRHVLVLTA